MEKAGFVEVEFKGTTGFNSSKYTVGALIFAKKSKKSR
jgi:hypothetical protein